MSLLSNPTVHHYTLTFHHTSFNLGNHTDVCKCSGKYSILDCSGKSRKKVVVFSTTITHYSNLQTAKLIRIKQLVLTICRCWHYDWLNVNSVQKKEKKKKRRRIKTHTGYSTCFTDIPRIALHKLNSYIQTWPGKWNLCGDSHSLSRNRVSIGWRHSVHTTGMVKRLLTFCLTSAEARFLIRDGDSVCGWGRGERVNARSRAATRKTEEAVDRRQNNGSVQPVLNWENVCSPNTIRTVRRTMICFSIELLVRRKWFGHFDELYFVLS